VTDRRTDAGENADTYAYRPSVSGPFREFKLSDEGVDWIAGPRSGHIPYRNIRCLRMSYRPTSMQSYRFVTELWAEGAPKLKIISSSWKSMFEQERLDKTYSAFVRELHRRISNAPTSPRFKKGRAPFMYWPGLAAFVGVVIGLAGLIVRALQDGAPGAATFVGAFLLLFLWQGGNFFRRNRPGVYRPEAFPEDVMPSQ
jgi:hypothetical protein